MSECEGDQSSPNPLDGQITNFLSSPLPKNMPLYLMVETSLEPSPSHPTKGAYRDRHERGVGCDGRKQRQQTNGADADGEVVWS
jgi:hypothetical protein